MTSAASKQQHQQTVALLQCTATKLQTSRSVRKIAMYTTPTCHEQLPWNCTAVRCNTAHIYKESKQ